MVKKLVIGDGLEYTVYRVRKRSGGERIIHAPNDKLKAIQLKILHELEIAVVPSPFAHGFRSGRNIVTNALPHVGKKLVINMDIKDFFPSCDASKLHKLVYGIDKELAEKVSRYCVIVTSDGKTERSGLPQGAPTSPLLSNLYLRDFDWTVARILKDYENADYTRYADDLTISGDDEQIRGVIGAVGRILLRKYGLRLNEKKTRIMRRHRRQDVCGIVVNEKINLNREYRKLLRAMKHQENVTIQAKGHYSFEHAVYGIEYNEELHRTETIINAWKVARRLTGDMVR